MRDDAVRFRKVYLAMGYTDLRSDIDRLATLVKKKFDLDPFQKDVLFLFCGRRKDRFKGLVWRGDGFLLIYKRIESGYVQWPRDSDEMADISPEEFRSLLDGFQILAKPTIREAACTEIARTGFRFLRETASGGNYHNKISCLALDNSPVPGNTCF